MLFRKSGNLLTSWVSIDLFMEDLVPCSGRDGVQ
jgi:hypothetical protein